MSEPGAAECTMLKGCAGWLLQHPDVYKLLLWLSDFAPDRSLRDVAGQLLMKLPTDEGVQAQVQAALSAEEPAPALAAMLEQPAGSAALPPARLRYLVQVSVLRQSLPVAAMLV